MNGKHFKYDPQKLNYEKVEVNLRRKVQVFLLYISVSLVISLVLVVLYSLFFDTPREREIKQENQELSKDYQLLSEKYAKIDTVLEDLKRKDKNIYRTIFETEPVVEEDFDNNQIDFTSLVPLSNKKILDSTIIRVNLVLKKINLQSVEYNNLLNNATRKEEMLRSIPSIQPISNSDLSRLASGFGKRMHPMYKIVRFHEGMDFTAQIGAEVYATGDGVVAEIEKTNRGKGNTIIINHGFGYRTIYCNLDKFNVRKGSNVQRGDIIAWVGNTGLSVAPHLHYEVHLNGQAVNPVNYYFLELSPSQYNLIIDLSAKSGQSFD